MEASTPKEFFEKILPERFNPSKASGVDVIVQVEIAGANKGDWIVTIKEKKLDVKEGTYPSPNLLLKMDENDFLRPRQRQIKRRKSLLHWKDSFQR